MDEGSASGSRCEEEPPAALLRGIQQFNQEQFFEQHETLEDLWIEESDSVRYLYQGILQVGVGFLHLRRANFRGAVGLLDRGLNYLAGFAPVCMSVDVARLIAETERARAALLELGPMAMGNYDQSLIPRVHLVGEMAENGRTDV